MKRLLQPASFILLTLLLSPVIANATPEYSASTKQGCRACHLEATGGALTDKGLEFAASGYTWPPKGGYRVIGPIRKPVRFIIGYVHILAAFIWFGTILYVHLILKPAYAEKGLPKGEVRLGAVSMFLVGVTGILLTISRIKSVSVLFGTPWGIVLSLKVLLYMTMVASALFVVLFIGRKLKDGTSASDFPESGVFDPVTLGGFDGKDGRRALIAYEGKVYDVTGLKLWKDGLHVKHLAGGDLSEFLSKAPHGAEKLEGREAVGSYDDSMKPPKNIYQRIFHIVAYMNLILVFVVLFVIAYWRWGI